MIDSLNIGKYIYSVLSVNMDIKNLVGNRIYPLVADNDAKFPFIVYKRTGLISEISKDGSYEDEATIEINIITDKYATGIILANLVRKTLEVSYASYGNMEINDTKIILATEDYANDAYVQKINFNFKINN